MPYNYLRSKIPAKRRRRLPKKVLIPLLILVLAGVGFAALELSNTTYILHDKPKPAVTASPNTKGEPSGKKNGSKNDSNSSQTGSNSTTDGDQSNDPKTPSSGGATPQATLVTPSGNLVSNHRPNRSGSPAPSKEESICNTTPGATCQIIFTKGGTTRSLPAQTTDRGGAAYWTWDVRDLLEEGEWHVQAKATLGSQTKTFDDVIPLKVGP